MSYYSDESARTTYIDPKIYVPNVRASWELDASEAAYLVLLHAVKTGDLWMVKPNYVRKTLLSLSKALGI